MLLITTVLGRLMLATGSRSTLLRAIGQGLVVGFPKNLHALYVEQLEGTDGAMSVLNTVMQADKEALSWRQHASQLQVANSRTPHQCIFLGSSSGAASFPYLYVV